MKRYYELNEDTMPPLKLEPCISASGETVILAEPLAHLISCIQQCLLQVKKIHLQTVDKDSSDGEEEEEDGGSGSALTGLEEMLTSLTSRMIQADMEDFELDKAADFSTANSVGVRNNIFAILLMGTYEVLIEHKFATGNLSKTCCEHILQLFSKRKSLCDVLKEKAGGNGNRKGRTTSSMKTPNSLLSLSCIVSMLETLLSSGCHDQREGLELLQRNSDFGSYVMAVALQKLQQMADKGTCDGAKCSQEKLFTHCCTLGRLFLSQYMENQLATEGRDRNRKLVGACLEGLVHVITLASHRGEDAIKQCLSALVKSENEPDIHNHIKRFQRLVSTVLAADEDQRHLKDVSSLMMIISQLTAYLTPAGPEYEQLLVWVKTMCQDGSVDDVNTSKLLLGCLLKLSVQMKNLPHLLRDIMQDLHSQLGDVEQGVEVEDRTHFSLINSKTAAPHVIMLLLPYVDQDLDDTEWVIARMKADYAPHVLNDNLGATQQEGFEKLVCGRLAVLVAGFHELSQTAIPPGPCVAAIFKTITKFFTTVLSLIKYYLQMYATHSGHMSARFEKLVKLIGSQLNQHIYNFITFVQTVEIEQLEDVQKKDQRKKKTAKKNSQKDTKAKSVTVKGGKQDKMIPNVIFSIEEVERHLVKLGKKAKVNLMEYIKASTSRDFRINVQIVQESLQVSSDEEENTEEHSGGETSQNVQASRADSDAENMDPDNSRHDDRTDKTEAAPKQPAAKRFRYAKLKKGI